MITRGPQSCRPGRVCARPIDPLQRVVDWICLPLGNWLPSVSVTVSTWALTALWPGWAKIVRIVAATISPASFGTTPRTSLPPSSVMPVAMTTAQEAIR